MTGQPPGGDGAPPDRTGQPDSRAEQVLSQALRLMAGGASAERGRGESVGGAPRRLTTGQLLLLAAIVGLLVGITVGLLSLL